MEKYGEYENFFEIGKIVNVQGVRGEVRVMPYTDDITRFELLEEIFLKMDKGVKIYRIERVRYHKNFVLLNEIILYKAFFI